MKANVKTIIECVGPLCISEPVKKSKIISMSGKMERTRTIGMLTVMLSALEELLPKRYAIAICPTANKWVPPLDSDSSVCLAIKHIGYG
jgi:hypothetical protein